MDARVEEIKQRVKKAAADLQEDNRQMDAKLKGKAGAPKEPSVEQLKKETEEEFAQFFRDVKRKFGL